MKRLNKLGPDVLSATPNPPHLSIQWFASVAARPGAVVVDTREWSAFRASHLRGALHVPVDRAYPTVVGSFVEPEQRILLVVNEEERSEAVLALIRVGLDRVEGYITTTEMDAFLTTSGLGVSTTEVGVREFARRVQRADALVLDVRNGSEFAAGHVTGALNIAYTRLAVRQLDIPEDRPLLVHCLSGARSAVAVAFLERIGRNAIYVAGSYPAIAASGVAISVGAPSGVGVAA
jgi:hydroxyacylglutathione hydrolase